MPSIARPETVPWLGLVPGSRFGYAPSVICSNCGTENKAGRKFCARCASPLGLACPNCGAAYDPGDLFCGQCAWVLTPDAAAPTTSQATVLQPPTQDSPVAERRLVSVLFADLVGFTTIAEGHDAEDTRELLNRYFERAREVIGRYGGTVEKFIGDAVMAVWGAPVAREDDAERAVRAGLDLVDAVQTLGPGIQARAGVLTGEAAVTLGATNQGMVAGDLVNTASRLQSVAQPGTVLVGEATQRAASKAIAFEKAGEQHLKGKQAPVEAWRALRVVAETGGRNRKDTLEAPFVGRDEELRLFKDMFHATTREGRARLVSVIGPAGFGKTRLAWEFLKYIDGLADTVWWHEGRSPAYGDGISFWALGEMIRARCGLLETDDEQTTRAKVAETVAKTVTDEQERRWIEPALLALLGVETGVAPEQLVGAWRTFFERLAATAPVVLVFEDFHNADSGLIDFVDHILEWSRAYPIYVVTLARPELLERRTDWGAGKRNFTSIYLEPLPEAAMREMLAGLVPGLPEPAVKAIIARADGIPLYAVETIRMLLAEGKLALKDDVYVPVGDLTSLAVPETLTALIAARLDGLPPEDRALILDAAVLGQSFTPSALAAVSGQDEAAIKPRMQTLVKRELLTVGSDPRSPERGQYAFVQALIREVAYGMLAKRDRKTRHLAAARFFESLGSDELAGALAGHYLAAHHNAPEGPEAGALAGQARIALKSAADRAISLGAHGQAVKFLDQAIGITVNEEDRAELRVAAADSAESAARFDQADGYLAEVESWARSTEYWPQLAIVLTGRARLLVNRQQMVPAIDLLSPAIAELKDRVGDRELGAMYAQLGRAYSLHEDPELAIQATDVALVHAGRARDARVIADTLISKATALAGTGRLYESTAILRGALDLADRNGFVTTGLRARNNLSGFVSGDDPAEARELLRVGVEQARRIGDDGWAFALFQIDLFISFWVGRWDAMLAEIEASAQGTILEDERGFLDTVSSWILSARGEPDAARRAIDTAAHLAAQATNPTGIAYTTMVSPAWLALSEGRLAEAYELAIAAAALSWETYDDMAIVGGTAAALLGDRPKVAEIRRIYVGAGIANLQSEAILGVLDAASLALDGRLTEAAIAFSAPNDIDRRLGSVVPSCLATIVRATLIHPPDTATTAAAAEAREILDGLRAVAWLKLLDDAVAGSGSGSAQPARSPSESVSTRSG
jgi:class 3 adenylate cyclase/tetratricopeptide (TPR) repeat protein